VTFETEQPGELKGSQNREFWVLQL
jgi:hypothetical protein